MLEGPVCLDRIESVKGQQMSEVMQKPAEVVGGWLRGLLSHHLDFMFKCTD